MSATALTHFGPHHASSRNYFVAAVFAAVTVMLAFWSGPAFAAKRVALVIGNSSYQNVPKLPNPEADANAIADMFRKAGFDRVDLQTNVSDLEFKRALRKFEDVASDADVAVVFFAGHGFQIRGTNYMIPVDARLADERDAPDEAISLDRITETVGTAKQLALVIVDACRDNPFVAMKRLTATRGFARGLVRIDPADDSNVVVLYAAKDGSTAADGRGPHSPLTTALLDNLTAPGVDIRLAFGRVRDEVLQITDHAQEPFVYGSLGGSILALVPAKAEVSAPVAPVVAPALSEQANLELTFWNLIKDEKNPRLFEAYIKRYPNGAFADIARIMLDDLKTAALTPPTHTDDASPINDATLFNELRDRLYELNFDPGPLQGPATDAAGEAIREFQQQSSLAPTGMATIGLLRRLREIGGLKPWGAIVYGKDNGKWGMAWDEPTRKAAVASARASCGDARSCPVEISFFGTDCGVFAYSNSSWAITAREDVVKAKEAALTDCRKRGKSCQIVASVCADGAERFSAK